MSDDSNFVLVSVTELSQLFNSQLKNGLTLVLKAGTPILKKITLVFLLSGRTRYRKKILFYSFY